jgi:hypothetical protein
MFLQMNMQYAKCVLKPGSKIIDIFPQSEDNLFAASQTIRSTTRGH